MASECGCYLTHPGAPASEGVKCCLSLVRGNFSGWFFIPRKCSIVRGYELTRNASHMPPEITQVACHAPPPPPPCGTLIWGSIPCSPKWWVLSMSCGYLIYLFFSITLGFDYFFKI